MARKQKSDLSRAFSEDGEHKTHIGGQALIEGIMMRGKLNWAVAVREPSGSIYTEEHDLASGKQKNKWMYWPLVRGCVALVESLGLGYKALEIAAMHAYDDSEEASNGAFAPAADDTPSVDDGGAPAADGVSAIAAADAQQGEPASEESGGLGKGAMTVSMILGLIGFFVQHGIRRLVDVHAYEVQRLGDDLQVLCAQYLPEHFGGFAQSDRVHVQAVGPLAHLGFKALLHSVC